MIELKELDERSIIHMEMIRELDNRVEKLEKLILSIKELIDNSGIEDIYED